MHTYKFNPKRLPTFKYIANLDGDVRQFQGNDNINDTPTPDLKTVVNRLIVLGHKWTELKPYNGELGSEYAKFTHKSGIAFLTIINCNGYGRFIVLLHMHEMGNQAEGHTCFTFKQIKDVFDSVPYCN